jgi:hypothetical protein
MTTKHFKDKNIPSSSTTFIYLVERLKKFTNEKEIGPINIHIFLATNFKYPHLTQRSGD